MAEYAGDGIDDNWQVTHFGAPPNANAAPTIDADGDPKNNLYEFLTGFDPNDGNAFFQMDSNDFPAPTTFELNLNKVIPGRTYRILSSPDLVTWTEETNFTVGAEETNRVVPLTVGTGDVRKFFRVEVEAGPKKSNVSGSRIGKSEVFCKRMTALPKENQFFDFDDYLEWEQGNEIKHEYFDGEVFAMAGASDKHDLVTGNIFADLHRHLRGKGCRVHTADMKLKVKLKHAEASYYPDAMVVCAPEDSNSHYKTRPRVIIEVMSDFRRDQVEKFMVYQHVDSLEEYLVISQDPEKQKAWIYRRETGWDQEIVKPGKSITLPSIEFSVPLTELYQS